MPGAPTISTQKPADAAFDYEELRKIGIQYLEKTASSLWTDFNIHDPGITSLEILCFALTDLSYRSAYSIPDLLATEKNTAENIQKHFFSAKQIFPNKAVTINDYRKLLIDIKGIKNAWLKKRTKPIFADLINKCLSFNQPKSRRWEIVNIKGYYDILLEFDTNEPDERKIEIKNDVKLVLLGNRNISEDFLSINEVKKQGFRLCIEAEIKSTSDPFDTLAKIFFNIQLHLTPLIKFYRLKELLDQNYTPDKIFEGPLLSHGFIKEEDLISSVLKSEIHLSDIMHEILREDAVINILDIIFDQTGQTNALSNKWVINVPEGQQPIVNILESKIVFYKDGHPFRPEMNKVKQKYDKLIKDYTEGNELAETDDINYDTGSYQNIENYYSIQNHYPKNYGISHWGLPSDASNERKVQKKQLQGYLYFFDQQLANYLSQLSHIRNLFSLEEEKKTYFTQFVNNFKDGDEADFFSIPELVNSEDILEYKIAYENWFEVKDGLKEDIDKEVLKRFAVILQKIKTNKIQELAEDPKIFHKRRNIFLDHLLSRFAESFFDYVSILHPADPSFKEEEILKVKNHIITAKIDFLKNYPEYSCQRFNAYNYSDSSRLWDTENISGLEKRIQRLLGFENITRRNLVNIYSVINQVTNEANVEEFWFEILDNRTGNILMLAAERFSSAEAAQRRLEDVYLFSHISNFATRVDNIEEKFIFEIKDTTGHVIAISNDRYNTIAEVNAKLSNMVLLLNESQVEEGLFLVENHLLLPELNAEQLPQSPLVAPLSPIQSPPLSPPNVIVNECEENGFMPICVDEDCGDCDTRDPYSFRISIVLPAYAKRFLNMDFRRYCERVIRTEIPAHIYPKICWVSNEQLQEFEKAYNLWLSVKAGNIEDTDKNILKRFVKILTTLKTIYPVARLEDCSNTEERKLFLLNQNALGTLKS